MRLLVEQDHLHIFQTLLGSYEEEKNNGKKLIYMFKYMNSGTENVLLASAG